MDEKAARLTAATMALEALQPRLETGAPWPLAERFDHTPEASWGPMEVLAHTQEMLPFWLGEIERVVAGGVDEPVPFGRIARNDLRIGIIERDRTVPIRELLGRIEASVRRLEERLPELSEAEAARRGLHETLGELSVAEIAERFLVGHLEEHVAQLESILVERAAGEAGEAATDPATGS